MSALSFLGGELAALRARGLGRRLRLLEGAQRPEVIVEGRAVVNFSSNDYLGLAADPTLIAAAHAALDRSGFGAGASRLIAGNQPAHVQLEAALARFHELPAVLLFNSGYQANVGVVSALAGPDDLIVSDALNHASVIDGCRLSRARVEIVRHRDVDAVAAVLASVQGRRRFVVTDALFSMDGHAAPVAELRAVCDRHAAALLVDEAHAVGVVGPGGRGLCAAQGVRPDVLVGTLGKAFGAFGAYVAGSRDLVEWLLNRARSFVFSTALPPSIPAAALAALAVVESVEGDRRRRHLHDLTRRFVDGIRSLDLPQAAAEDSPIQPIVVGEPERTMSACERLLALGVFAQGIRPPTVPAGTARLRFSLTAAHSAAHVDRALEALQALAHEGLLPRR